MRLLKGMIVLLVALALIAAALAWTAPAGLAYRLGSRWLGPFTLQGVAGSVWDGTAQNVVALGVALGPVDWRVARREALFERRLVGDANLRGTVVHGSAAIDQRGDTIALRDVDATFPAALLGPALDIPALLFTGAVQIRAPQAELVDGLLTTAQGDATWRDIGIAGAAQARLPGVVVTFAPDAAAPRAIAATIRDLGGALAIDGTLQLRDGSFLLEATLSLREDNPQLAELLTYVGQRRDDGSSYLRVEGTLTPLW